MAEEPLPEIAAPPPDDEAGDEFGDFVLPVFDGHPADDVEAVDDDIDLVSPAVWKSTCDQ